LGHDVDIATPGSSGYGYNSRFLPWLKERASTYDCAIVNGIWNYHSLAVKKSGIPYFVYPHGSMNPWFRQAYPLKHLKKKVYWHLVEESVLRGARALLFCTEEERELAAREFPIAEMPGEVTSYCAPEPPDPTGYAETFRARHPELADRRIILFLARIHPMKALDVLLARFAQLNDPRLHLVIAGPGPQGHSSERVTWLGPLYGEEKWQAFAAADLYALFSHCENFGVSVAEALACGLPVAISRNVNIWREIEQDGAGFFGENALEEWLATGPEKLAAMRANARRCYLARYHASRMVPRLLDALARHVRIETTHA
jgi:glycosyltransferase involved in cell wall biosynthesis